jgi:hypothetical protein
VTDVQSNWFVSSRLKTRTDRAAAASVGAAVDAARCSTGGHVNARIARGEPVSGADYYLRTVPFFETSSPKYAWINKIVSVGVGERRADSVVYQVFEIL